MKVTVDGQTISNAQVITITEEGAPTPEPTPTPTPTPPSGEPTNPYIIRALHRGTERFAIQGGDSLAFEFNSSEFPDGVLFQLGGELGPNGEQPSLKTAVTLSKCPGDFRTTSAYACAQSGREPGLRAFPQGKGSATDCIMQPNTLYYLNVGPVKLNTYESTMDPPEAIGGVVVGINPMSPA